MSHVKPLTKDQAPETARLSLSTVEEKFGQSLNIFSTMAYQPDVLKGALAINEGLHNDLPEKYRELAYFKASQINACDYCSHYHSRAAQQAGVSGAQIQVIGEFRDNDAFSEEETAVLEYAEQLTRTADVDDTTVSRLKRFLDDTQLVTLAATVALANFTNRFNHGLGIELP